MPPAPASSFANARAMEVCTRYQAQRQRASLSLSIWTLRYRNICLADGCSGADERTHSNAVPGTQWIYSSVSKASLQKTGVFLNSAAGFWESSAQKVRTSVSRDIWRSEKPAIGGAFCNQEGNSLKHALDRRRGLTGGKDLRRCHPRRSRHGGETSPQRSGICGGGRARTPISRSCSVRSGHRQVDIVTGKDRAVFLEA
jgi:hypothetical protein